MKNIVASLKEISFCLSIAKKQSKSHNQSKQDENKNSKTFEVKDEEN